MKLNLLRALLISMLLNNTLAQQPTFTRLTNDPVTLSTATTPAAFADWNRDGWLDLYFGVNSGTGWAYTNNGNGSFRRLTNTVLPAVSGPNFGAAWGDIDNDGWPDLLVGVNGGGNDALLRNVNGVFSRASIQQFPATGGNANNVAWADYDNDGLLDAFVANSDQNDFLLHNESAASFRRVLTNAIATEPGNSQGAAWADYDDDGLIDLYVSRVNTPGLLFRNLGGGRFLKVTNNVIGQTGGVSQGCAWIDYDNDGRLDLFVANPNAANWLFHNEGNGQFSRVTTGALVTDVTTHMGCAWADYDNDGWLDVFIAVNGGVGMFYRNNGNGSFTRALTGPVATDSGSAFAAAWGDIDNDGFQDLVVTHWRNETAYLYRNSGNTNHWLSFELEGRISNRSAIGAKVRLKARLAGADIWQLRHVSGGDGLGSHNDPRPSFGLRDAGKADRVRIEWPSGMVEEFQDVMANQFVKVMEPDLTIVPRQVEVSVGQACTFTASGWADPDAQYQWFHEGVLLPCETNTVLNIPAPRAGDGGSYFVEITNAATGRWIRSASALLIGPIVIKQPPKAEMARIGSNVIYEVTALGYGLLTYQWLKNGVPVPNATNSSLALTNIQLSDDAMYAVSVSNSFGAVVSSPASLVVLVRPTITIQPVSQSVPAGGSATFSVSVTGNPLPMSFRWRRGSTTVTNMILFNTNSFFTVTDTQPTAATNQFVFTVGVSNIAGAAAVSRPAVLTVLADDDADGLPDAWESTYGLDAATADPDQDGHSNLTEYLAGTDPTDVMDILRLDYSREVAGETVLFTARAGKTYCLESSRSPEGPWTTMRQLPAPSTTEVVRCPVTPVTNVFYRVRTPAF
jgi:hypothetical protein